MYLYVKIDNIFILIYYFKYKTMKWAIHWFDLIFGILHFHGLEHVLAIEVVVS